MSLRYSPAQDAELAKYIDRPMPKSVKYRLADEWGRSLRGLEQRLNILRKKNYEKIANSNCSWDRDAL